MPGASKKGDASLRLEALYGTYGLHDEACKSSLEANGPKQMQRPAQEELGGYQKSLHVSVEFSSFTTFNVKTVRWTHDFLSKNLVCAV